MLLTGSLCKFIYIFNCFFISLVARVKWIIGYHHSISNTNAQIYAIAFISHFYKERKVLGTPLLIAVQTAVQMTLWKQ